MFYIETIIAFLSSLPLSFFAAFNVCDEFLLLLFFALLKHNTLVSLSPRLFPLFSLLLLFVCLAHHAVHNEEHSDDGLVYSHVYSCMQCASIRRSMHR